MKKFLVVLVLVSGFFSSLASQALECHCLRVYKDVTVDGGRSLDIPQFYYAENGVTPVFGQLAGAIQCSMEVSSNFPRLGSKYPCYSENGESQVSELRGVVTPTIGRE